MDISDIILPEEVAAKATVLLAERESIPYNVAMIRFMHSESFHRLFRDDSFLSLGPQEVLNAYLEEKIAVRYKEHSERAYLRMKAAITMDYSDRYGVPFEETVDLFADNRIYDVLDENREEHILKTIPEMSEYVHEYLSRD